MPSTTIHRSVDSFIDCIETSYNTFTVNRFLPSVCEICNAGTFKNNQNRSKTHIARYCIGFDSTDVHVVADNIARAMYRGCYSILEWRISGARCCYTRQNNAYSIFEFVFRGCFRLYNFLWYGSSMGERRNSVCK